MKILSKIFIVSLLSTMLFAETPSLYGGIAKEVIHSGGYTYIQVQEKNAGTFWAAVSSADVQVGDEIRFKKEFVTKKFHSSTLNRDFDEVMFASELEYKVKK